MRNRKCLSIRPGVSTACTRSRALRASAVLHPEGSPCEISRGNFKLTMTPGQPLQKRFFHIFPTDARRREIQSIKSCEDKGSPLRKSIRFFVKSWECLWFAMFDTESQNPCWPQATKLSSTWDIITFCPTLSPTAACELERRIDMSPFDISIRPSGQSMCRQESKESTSRAMPFRADLTKIMHSD